MIEMKLYPAADCDPGVKMKDYNDGTPNITMGRTLREKGYKELRIAWRFDAGCWEKELFRLECIMDELRQTENRDLPVELFMPYVPNARMDRVPPGKDNVFTLRTFARIINGIGFDRVVVYDPHSDVTPALIDRCKVVTPKKHLAYVAECVDDPLWVFPDAGAMHRYRGLLPDDPSGVNIMFGEKLRDWNNQNIIGYKLYGTASVRDRNIVVVDDIIAHGYTLLFLLRELAWDSPKSVTVYASHIEESYIDGALYKATSDGEFGFPVKIVTSDSVIRHWPYPAGEMADRIVTVLSIQEER